MRLGHVTNTLVFENSHSQDTKIVDQSDQVRRTLAHRRFFQTEPGKSPSVLELVKDVFGIRPPAEI
jgi:hypothetical protein